MFPKMFPNTYSHWSLGTTGFYMCLKPINKVTAKQIEQFQFTIFELDF